MSRLNRRRRGASPESPVVPGQFIGAPRVYSRAVPGRVYGRGIGHLGTCGSSLSASCGKPSRSTPLPRRCGTRPTRTGQRQSLVIPQHAHGVRYVRPGSELPRSRRAWGVDAERSGAHRAADVHAEIGVDGRDVQDGVADAHVHRFACSLRGTNHSAVTVHQLSEPRRPPTELLSQPPEWRLQGVAQLLWRTQAPTAIGDRGERLTS